MNQLYMGKNILLLWLSLLAGVSAYSQTSTRLYKERALGSEKGGSEVAIRIDSLGKLSYLLNDSTLTAFLPDSKKATGTAVLIFPDNNLKSQTIDSLSLNVAKRLVDTGIAAFIVKHKALQQSLSGTGKADSLSAASQALEDGQRAIEYLRQHATGLKIQTTRIGLLGFGAGGELVLQLAQRYVAASRPDFIASVNAANQSVSTVVVPPDALALWVVITTGDTQQAAIQHTQLYQHWIKAGRSAELHIYAASGNGKPIDQSGESWTIWIDQLVNWLRTQGYLDRALPTAEQSQAQTVVPEKTLATNEATTVVKTSVAKAPVTQSAPVVFRKKQPSLNQASGFRVSGVVRDSATGQPLAGAAIVIDYRKSLTGTTTDSKGYYSIDLPPGEHLLVARIIGYTPVRKIFQVRSEPITVNVAMVSVASQLEEVVVTTKGFDQTVRQPILGVNQLNVNALKKLPAVLGEVDLLRGLQMLPGVSSVGEASNGVNIRGGTTDQNLILLDETPIFNPTHMFGLFSVFPSDVLSTVDLYKGNVPARFGGRAASVLDVSLRNPNLEQFSLSGGVSVVSNKLTADIPIVKGKLGVLVSGRGAFNDFLLPVISDKLANIKAKFGDVVLKAFWRMDDKNTMTFMGYTSKDAFQTDLLANLPNVNGTATRYDHQTLNLMARWFRSISPRLNLQTTGTYVHYVPRILSPELSGNVVTLRSSVLQRQVKSSLNYQLDNHKLELGVSGTHYRVEPGTLLPGQSESVNYVTTPTENALELALYADYERSLGDKLAVSVGLRYSHFLSLGPLLVRRYRPGETRDEFSVIDSIQYGAGQITQQYGGFEPRLGIRYSLGPNASLKFGYNLMRQYLQVVTNTATPLPTSRWKTSDPFIKPQVSQLLTAGYFLTMKDNIYELTLEGYWRSTQHIIDYRPGADFLLQPYPETQLLQGKSKAYGVETMLSKKKGELTGWLNYTYARTFNQVYEGATVEQNVNNGNWYRAIYDRPHTVNANMTIDVDRHNSFGFTFSYSTGRPYSSPTGYVTIEGVQYPYYGLRNNERLPAYHRLDFTWNIYNPSMRNRRWEGRWAFTVYNLYARKNAYSIFFKTESGNTNAYMLQIFAAPIASLSYNFVFK